MSCLICAGYAETIEAQDWEERRCDRCGITECPGRSYCA